MIDKSAKMLEWNKKITCDYDEWRDHHSTETKLKLQWIKEAIVDDLTLQMRRLTEVRIVCHDGGSE